jgi:hypothetical protein
MSNLTAAQAARLEEIIAHTRPSLLSREKHEALILGGARTVEALQCYERASGYSVLPTSLAKSNAQRLQDRAAESPTLERVLTNCGRIKAPMLPELKRIIGNTGPSLLSPVDRQSLIDPKVVEILGNFQRASGCTVLPIDLAKTERKP